MYVYRHGMKLSIYVLLFLFNNVCVCVLSYCHISNCRFVVLFNTNLFIY